MKRARSTGAHAKMAGTGRPRASTAKPSQDSQRTTIMLPQALHSGAMAYARRRGVSLSALIRSVLLDEIEGRRPSFLDREVVFQGKPPSGAPRHHDDIYS